MTVTRKAIAAALLKQLNVGDQFAATGRRDNKPEQAASPERPGIFLLKPREVYSYGADQHGVPPVREFHYQALMYTDIGSDQTAVPADLVDDLLDVIDAALAPGFVDQVNNGGRQTLGGLVYDCRVEGDVELAPGDVQGKGMVLIPIHVIVNQYP